MFDQALEWLFDKVHGLGFAAAILGALLAWAATRKNPGEELLFTLAIWATTIVLFYVGGRLDGILYDPLFGTKGLLSNILDTERKDVLAKFEKLDWSTNEIQEASRSVFEHTTQWDDHVRLSYEMSKACRTFIVPLLLLFVYEMVGWPWGNITAEFREGPLGRPALVAGLWLTMVCLYLGLRLLHNKRLYNLVTKAKIFSPSDFSVTSHLISADKVTNKKEKGVSYQFVCFRRI